MTASSPPSSSRSAPMPFDSTRGQIDRPPPDVPRFTRAVARHTRLMRAWNRRRFDRALRIGWTAAVGATLLAVAAVLLPASAAASAPHVEQADLDGDINNIMAAYIETSVSRAEADHADALVVVINTPGGISTSMDQIVTDLLNSRIPVIAYVNPSGARAASAGLFVAQAADVLATAPGTNIG